MDVHSVPAYVRAGGIVPRGRIYQGNDRWTEDWSPELTIELYPSPDVPMTTFLYYNGDIKGEVPIRMKMDPASCDVVLEYGAVGLNGTIKVFDKRGTRTAPLNVLGTVTTFSNVDSLFTK